MGNPSDPLWPLSTGQWSKGIPLSVARKSLALEWQKLGLSPALAKNVANSYRAEAVPHPSVAGRSDQEVSAMIHDALVARKYALANQLLIDFERNKVLLKDGAEELSGR